MIKAATAGHGNIVKMLMKKGSDVNIKNYQGETALLKAVKAGNLKIVMELLYYGTNGDSEDINEALMKAVNGGYINNVVALLDKGANVDARDSLGKTAFIKAVKLGHDKIITTLIDC